MRNVLTAAAKFRSLRDDFPRERIRNRERRAKGNLFTAQQSRETKPEYRRSPRVLKRALREGMPPAERRPAKDQNHCRVGRVRRVEPDRHYIARRPIPATLIRRLPANYNTRRPKDGGGL